MYRTLRFGAVLGVSVLLAQFTLLSVADTGDVRPLNVEESSAIWGASSHCFKTDTGTTEGCNGIFCNPALNTKAEGPGTTKIESRPCPGGTGCTNLTIPVTCG